MNVLLERMSNFSIKRFFEMLLRDGCSKTSNDLLYKTPMDASGWIKKEELVT